MDRTGGPSTTQGQIQVILGPMFSGKSTELIRRVRRFQVARHKCLLIEHDRNTRYTTQGEVCTHDGCTMDAIRVSSLAEAMPAASEVDVVAIDEGQFFSDTVGFCEAMADMGKVVIVAALDGTYRREPFGHILDIIPRAESVVKLSAICSSCYGEAAYSMRTGSETQVELVGGADKYQAACRGCHRNPETPDVT